VVYDVLEELGIKAKDTLLVLNKADVADRGQMVALMGRYPHAIAASARTGWGLDRLTGAVSEALSHSFLDVDVEMGVDNGRLLATLARHGEVLSKRYTDSRVIVHCRIPQRALGHLHAEAAAIRPHGRPAGDAEGNGKLTSGNGRAVYHEPARKANGDDPARL
jgi:GTP-binding protein HflX